MGILSGRYKEYKRKTTDIYVESVNARRYEALMPCNLLQTVRHSSQHKSYEAFDQIRKKSDAGKLPILSIRYQLHPTSKRPHTKPHIVDTHMSLALFASRGRQKTSSKPKCAFYIQCLFALQVRIGWDNMSGQPEAQSWTRLS